ncbi:MAG: S41 family peptidase [Pyrinomonadaceae bacterium]
MIRVRVFYQRGTLVKRFLFARIFVIALLVNALTFPIFVVAQQQTQRRDGVSGLQPNRTRTVDKSSRSRTEALADIEQSYSDALSLVEENYVDGNKLDYNTALKSATTGMLRVLDPHSNYYDAKEFEELRSDWRSEYFGIGATIVSRRVDDKTDTYISATFDNSPANRAGLRFGDRIVEVDGQDMHGKDSSEVRDKMRGPRNTKVVVTVERGADNKRETVEIIRAAVSQPSVPDAYIIRPGVGYVDMRRGFNYTTADEFQIALDALHKQGVNSIILDLRDNPGGLLDQAVRVASQFLQRGQVVLSQKGRITRDNRVYNSDNNAPDQTSLVVLVNRGTASASEIVAGALQDHDRALVIGETSFGKGLVQSIIPLEQGSALTLTTSKYYTPSGRLIQRDYSKTSLYDYYTRGGVGRLSEAEKNGTPDKPAGPEMKTDTGRIVYGGGGISPDEFIKPVPVETLQQQFKFIDPIFAFVREVVDGRIAGFDNFKSQNKIEFNHDLKSSDDVVTDDLYKAFKAFVAGKSFYKLSDAQIERQRDFVRRQIRYDLVTAAYGTTAAQRVLVADEPQIAKAVEVLPRARELAIAAAREHNPQQKSFE